MIIHRRQEDKISRVLGCGVCDQNLLFLNSFGSESFNLENGISAWIFCKGDNKEGGKQEVNREIK